MARQAPTGAGRAVAIDMGAGSGLMEGARRYVVFAVADRCLALAVEQVERVIHAVGGTPVEGVPAIVRGAVNLHGDMVPVIDMRRRLGLAERDIGLSDQLILVQRGALRWFLVCDGVAGVVELADNMLKSREGSSPGECCSAEAMLDESVVEVLDLAKLLSIEETSQVRRALAQGAGG